MNPTLKIQTPKWAVPLLGDHRYKGAHGGRGGGKSHIFAEMMIEKMVINPNIHCVCIREYMSSIKMSVKRLLEIKIKQLGVESYFEVQDSIIKSKKGDGYIIFKGMQNHTADSIKSLEGFDICWCEEAQSLSQRSLDMLRPTIRKEGSEMWFSWNPSEPTDPIDVFLRSDDPITDSVVVQVNYMDNPWFPDVLRIDMEYDKRRDPDKYAHVWLGGYRKNSASRVFHNWEIKDFETPPDALHRQGADWGFSKDPSVMVRSHVIGRDLFIDYEAYMVGCEIDDTPKLFMSIPDARKWPCSADSARPETISYMRKHGFPKMFAATKGRNSIYEGVEFLKTYNIYIHPRCPRTADEFSSYSWKVDPKTGLILPILADKKNHVMDALRYSNEKHRLLEKNTQTDNVIPIPTINRWNNARFS
ncbi:PBSX family phage terminase large subunit [Candidatus Pacearchaeota archaeon]|nr:PBSX family phage terminase large subunit [Candidatus Pacearchaeota archaeon]